MINDTMVIPAPKCARMCQALYGTPALLGASTVIACSRCANRFPGSISAPGTNERAPCKEDPTACDVLVHAAPKERETSLFSWLTPRSAAKELLDEQSNDLGINMEIIPPPKKKRVKLRQV